LPSDRVMDGHDLVAIANGETVDRPLFWRSGHYRSVLAGGWKLQVAERPAVAANRCPGSADNHDF